MLHIRLTQAISKCFHLSRFIISRNKKRYNERSRSVGTGRQARFRTVWGNPWRFESSLRHSMTRNEPKRHPISADIEGASAFGSHYGFLPVTAIPEGMPFSIGFEVVRTDQNYTRSLFLRAVSQREGLFEVDYDTLVEVPTLRHFSLNKKSPVSIVDARARRRSSQNLALPAEVIQHHYLTFGLQIGHANVLIPTPSTVRQLVIGGKNMFNDADRVIEEKRHLTKRDRLRFSDARAFYLNVLLPNQSDMTPEKLAELFQAFQEETADTDIHTQATIGDLQDVVLFYISHNPDDTDHGKALEIVSSLANTGDNESLAS